MYFWNQPFPYQFGTSNSHFIVLHATLFLPFPASSCSSLLTQKINWNVRMCEILCCYSNHKIIIRTFGVPVPISIPTHFSSEFRCISSCTTNHTRLQLRYTIYEDQQQRRRRKLMMPMFMCGRRNPRLPERIHNQKSRNRRETAYRRRLSIVHLIDCKFDYVCVDPTIATYPTQLYGITLLDVAPLTKFGYQFCERATRIEIF